MRIPDDVLIYMAQLVQSNIRTLEGALVKLIAYASMVNSPVTTQLASDVLERYYQAAGIAPQPRMSMVDDSGVAILPPTPATGLFGGSSAAMRSSGAKLSAEIIQQVVARRFGLTPDALSGKRRDKETARARAIAMHLMRELTETSLPGIGRVFGDRDHTTVMHACSNIREQIPLDTSLKNLVEDLLTQIRTQTEAP
jgi:chromosomal replication initiator protein